MALELPKRRIESRQIQIPKRNVPLEQIIAVQGRSPIAEGITALSGAIQKRAELREEGERIAKVESAYGLEPGTLTGFGEESALSLGKQVSENRKPTYVQQINPDGTANLLEIPAGGKFGGTVRTPTPGLGTITQTSYVDSADGTPLILDKTTRSYLRVGENKAPIGKAVPSKGQAEATQSTSRALEILPKIDILFDSLSKKSELGARTATAPFIGRVAYPEINQLKNEVKQIGFTFGGKNFTGTEEQIITDALIPGPLDNDASREAKRKALKGYISGQTDLLGAANLLGPAGNRIKAVIKGNNLDSIESNEVERITPDGRVGVFDSKTKKFLRYKQ